MQTTLKIQNLKCGGCAKTITSKLSEINGISNVSVQVEDENVSFDFTADDTLENAIHKLKNIGYPIVGEDNSFGDKAKSYVSCAIGKIS